MLPHVRHDEKFKASALGIEKRCRANTAYLAVCTRFTIAQRERFEQFRHIPGLRLKSDWNVRVGIVLKSLTPSVEGSGAVEKSERSLFKTVSPPTLIPCDSVVVMSEICTTASIFKMQFSVQVIFARRLICFVSEVPL